jgi:hypothetical protein
VASPFVLANRALGNMEDYNSLDQDLLRSSQRDAVMTYFISSPDLPPRKAVVAVVMMKMNLTADDAIRHISLGGE